MKRNLRGEKRVVMRRMLYAMGKRDVGSDAPTEGSCFIFFGSWETPCQN